MQSIDHIHWRTKILGRNHHLIQSIHINHRYLLMRISIHIVCWFFQKFYFFLKFYSNFSKNKENYPFNWNNLSYPSFYNTLPPTNYSLLPPPPLPPLPSHTVLHCQRAAQSIPVKKPKRPRLTARIRSEIIKIKSSKPSIFIWEIQQNLIKTGVCTSQTVPNVKKSHPVSFSLSFLSRISRQRLFNVF